MMTIIRLTATLRHRNAPRIGNTSVGEAKESFAEKIGGYSSGRYINGCFNFGRPSYRRGSSSIWSQ